MNQKPIVTAPKTTNGGNGLLWLVVIVGSVAALTSISKCSSSTTTRTAAEVATSDPTIKSLHSAVASQTPPVLKALDLGSVKAGFADMTAAMAAEGLSGAMIYSQNCYEALSRTFSWRLLDVCGAADLKAVTAVPEDEVVNLEKEIAYFQSEVAAARYLGAATGGGTTTENADARLAKMQARLPTPKPIVDDSTGIDNASTIDSPQDGGSNAEVASGTA